MTRRLISKESHQRGTKLPLLTACTKCRRKWLEDSITLVCVFCKEKGKTISLTIGTAHWEMDDGPD